ncbi:MAG: hypothetical protein KDA45_05360 [Planctomycetales bacterium]|nr:hypothetical protein [Planctomycetales bacterium]
MLIASANGAELAGDRGGIELLNAAVVPLLDFSDTAVHAVIPQAAQDSGQSKLWLRGSDSLGMCHHQRRRSIPVAAAVFPAAHGSLFALGTALRL